MRFLSVCSGIEAASVAWRPLGWTCAAVAEIEDFPAAVLAHHFSEVPNLGDITAPDFCSRVPGPVHLLVGGTPCQSFSVAGLRKGLADPRGNLALVFLGLVDRLRPEWVVWENVPGVLSSTSHDAPDPRPPEGGVEAAAGSYDGEAEDGSLGEAVVGEDGYDAGEVHAFQSFLAGLSELGYGWAYRVVDAQYFGVAQRRRRVFVVAHPRAACAAAVLLERSSLSGDPAPSREAGTGTAHAVAPSLRGCGPGVERSGDSRGQDPVVAVGGGVAPPADWPAQVAPTLNAHFGEKQGLEDQHALGGGGLFVPAAPIYATDGQANAAFSEDAALSLTATNEQPYLAVPETVGALTAKGPAANGAPEVNAHHCIPEGGCFEGPGYINPRQTRNSQSSNQVGIKPDAQVADALSTDGPGAILEPLGFDRAQITSAQNYISPKPGEPQPPLNTAGQGEERPVTTPVTGSRDPSRATPLAVDQYNHTLHDQVPTLGQNTGNSTGRAGILEPIAFSVRGREGGAQAEVAPGGLAPALRDGSAGGSSKPCIAFSQNQREEVRDLGDCAAAVKPPGTHEATFVAGDYGAGDYRAGDTAGAITGTTDRSRGAPLAVGPMSLKTDATLKVGEDLAHTLTQPSPSGGGQPPAVMSQMRVRRLTPTECERLQGFPDGWTLIPNYRAKQEDYEEMAEYLGMSVEEVRELGVTPDGPRYRALGNSMAVPVVRWIGERIQMVQSVSECQPVTPGTR